MMARRKIVILAAGLLGALVLGAGLGGCKDLTFNGDMKGYLEYWTDTVSVASARWSASPEQQTAGGRTTVATNATITASLTISNPEGYSLESVVSHASSGPHAVEVSGPASGTVLGLTKVTAVTPTSLSVEVASVAHVPTPASLALEHTDFTVKISPTRSETAMQSPNPLVLSLRYNTPPRMPLEVVYDGGTGRLRWMESERDKWEVVTNASNSALDNYIFWAWPKDITDLKNPDYVAYWLVEDSTGRVLADRTPAAELLMSSQATLAGLVPTDLSDAGYDIYCCKATSGVNVTVCALDCEGVKGSGAVSGAAPYKITLKAGSGFFASSGNGEVVLYKAPGSHVSGGDFEIPYYDGNYLSDWIKDDGSAATFPLEVGQPMSLTAKWEPNPPASSGTSPGSGTGTGTTTYTITYNGNNNDGGTPPTSQTKVAGRSLTLKGNTGGLAKTGYTFAGWNTQPNGQGTNYAAGAVYTADAGLTLYAKWEKVDYTITYNLDGGQHSGNPLGYTVEDLPIILKAPTRTGYTFTGWYKDGALISEIAAGVAENLTLTARWTANTYTVKFNANGGSGSMADQTFTYDDTTQSLTTNSFSYTNKVFDKWTTDQAGQGASYRDGQSTPNLPVDDGGTVTLYAQWTDITAATVVDYIKGLSGPGPHTVTVTGNLSPSQVIGVRDALLALKTSAPGAQVKLDLSGVTGLTELPDYAFNPANNNTNPTSNLKEVILPNTVTNIGWIAFDCCTSLTYVDLGSGVTHIEHQVFDWAGSLTTIRVSAPNPPTFGNAFPKSGITTIEVPSAYLSAYQSSPWANITTQAGQVTIVGY